MKTIVWMSQIWLALCKTIQSIYNIQTDFINDIERIHFYNNFLMINWNWKDVNSFWPPYMISDISIYGHDVCIKSFNFALYSLNLFAIPFQIRIVDWKFYEMQKQLKTKAAAINEFIALHSISLIFTTGAGKHPVTCFKTCYLT